MENWESKEIKLRPIGIIDKNSREDVMKITVYPEYAEGLDGIEELDYIYILSVSYTHLTLPTKA